jgi:hypothetical protein
MSAHVLPVFPATGCLEVTLLLNRFPLGSNTCVVLWELPNLSSVARQMCQVITYF